MPSRTEFKRIRTEFGLPRLNELEKTFGFVLDDDTETPLQDIKKAVVDTLATLQEVLEPILFISEGSAPSHVFESHVLNGRREIYFQLYKKNHELRWKSIEAFFEPTDANVAKLIKECYAVWNKEFKPKIMELTKLMEKSWKEFEDTDERPTYHG